jgi:hypothetical protein
MTITRLSVVAVVTLAATVVSIPVSRADCPNPLPEKLERPQLDACLLEISNLRRDVETLRTKLPSSVSGTDVRKAVLECDSHDQPPDMKADFRKTDVKIPFSALSAGYRLTGGGCSYYNNASQNGPIVESNPLPTNDGWHCKVADSPGVSTNAAIQAWVTYCRVSSQ